jgi:hypothetical protein
MPEGASVVVPDATNSQLTAASGADNLAGVIGCDQLRLCTSGTGDTNSGSDFVVATTGEMSEMLPQDGIDGRQISTRYDIDGNTAKFRLWSPSAPAYA